MQEAASYARRKSRARPRHYLPTPQRVAGVRVRAIGRGVEHEIGKLQPREMFRLRHVRREDKPRAIDAAIARFVTQIALGFGRGQQPHTLSGATLSSRHQTSKTAGVNLKA